MRGAVSMALAYNQVKVGQVYSIPVLWLFSQFLSCGPYSCWAWVGPLSGHMGHTNLCLGGKQGSMLWR